MQYKKRQKSNIKENDSRLAELLKMQYNREEYVRSLKKERSQRDLDEKKDTRLIGTKDARDVKYGLKHGVKRRNLSDWWRK